MKNKSILQSDRSFCYLCGRNGNGDPLEKHHIFPGNPGRKKSEEYGLYVWLCGLRCHREGPASAHKCSLTSLRLKIDAQQAFEQTHTREEFIQEFGKSVLR